MKQQIYIRNGTANVFASNFWAGWQICVLLLLLGCAGRGQKAPQKPNIIIIYADDVGYGDLSAYGSEKIQTPHIDKLASTGVRFTNAYATSAMCTPSRYSLLTGRYAFRHPSAGILSAEDPLIIEPGSATLPAVLKKAGYATAIVGKWHLGLGDKGIPINWNGQIKPGPLEVGFDESFIMPVTNDRVPTVFVQGHKVYNLSDEDDSLQVKYPKEGEHEYQEESFGKTKQDKSRVPQPLVGDLPSGHTHPEMLRYPADDQHSGTIVNGMSRIGYMAGGQSAWWDDEQMAAEFTGRASRFIEAHQDQPFFLYLAMHEPHVARIPNPRFVGKSGTSIRGDAILELDWAVGQVIDKVEKLGIRDKTLIIFSSDNGPVFYDGYADGAIKAHHGHDPSGRYAGGKYVAYEGGTRMPTMLSWPGHAEAGITSSALLSQVDILASLAAMVGVELPDSLDSKNMLPALLGESPKGRDHLVEQSSDGLALRQGKWKYIVAGPRSGWAYHRHNREASPLNVPSLEPGAYLFNLAADPQETQNLADERPEKLKQMKRLLEKIQRSD